MRSSQLYTIWRWLNHRHHHHRHHSPHHHRHHHHHHCTIHVEFILYSFLFIFLQCTVRSKNRNSEETKKFKYTYPNLSCNIINTLISIITKKWYGTYHYFIHITGIINAHSYFGLNQTIENKNSTNIHKPAQKDIKTWTIVHTYVLKIKF